MVALLNPSIDHANLWHQNKLMLQTLDAYKAATCFYKLVLAS